MNTEHNKAIAELHGYVSIIARNVATGETQVVAHSNLIVNGLYPNLAALLAGTITNRAIGSIRLGTGTTALDVTNAAVTAVKTITDLTITFPTLYQVKAVGVWASAESDANDIVEVGIFNAGSTLMARYVFAAMRKSVGWEWTINWTLTYTVV